jgi:hypothetical protein
MKRGSILQGFIITALLSASFLLTFSLVSYAETDVTSNIKIIKSSLMYDRKAGTSYFDVSLKNISQDVLLTPIKVVIESVSPSGVVVTNPDGVTTAGKPYFEYVVPSRNIESGRVTGNKRWVFLNPNRVRFSYVLKLLGRVPDASNRIGSQGGVIQVTDTNNSLYGTKVDIPPGAMGEQKTITISSVEQPSPLPGGLVAAGECIEFGPEGTNFFSPILVALPYNDKNNDGIIDGTTISESEVAVEYFNKATNEWEAAEVTGQDTDLNVVYIELNHFPTLITNIDDLRLRSTYDSSKKFFLKGKITGYNGDQVFVDLTFYNSTGTWVLLTPNFDQADYVDFTDVILIPPVVNKGSILSLGNVSFTQGQHLQLDVTRDPLKQPTPFVVTAIDLIMRGIFNTRLDLNSLNTAIIPTLMILGESGETGRLLSMAGYLAAGEEIKAAQEALQWLLSVDRSEIEAAFRNVLNLGIEYDAIIGDTLSNLLTIVSLPDKYYLLKELMLGYRDAPFDGYVKLEMVAMPFQTGTVWTWGSNQFGQLGDGTNTNRLTPVQVSGLSNVVAITGGTGHSIALKSDGTVWAWGWNFNGQLGDGTNTNRLTPVQVSGLSNVVAITGGTGHSMAH